MRGNYSHPPQEGSLGTHEKGWLPDVSQAPLQEEELALVRPPHLQQASMGAGGGMASVRPPHLRRASVGVQEEEAWLPGVSQALFQEEDSASVRPPHLQRASVGAQEEEG